MPTPAQQIPAEVWEIVLRYSFTALSGQRKRGRPKWWLMCRSITAALDLFSLQGSADSEKMLREGIFSLPPAGPPSTPMRFFAQRAAVCALTRSPVEFLQSIKCIDGNFVEPVGREEVQKGRIQDRSGIDRDVLQAVSSMTKLYKISGPFLNGNCLVTVDIRGLDELTAIGDCFLSNSTVERVYLPTKLESVGASFLAGTRVRQLDLVGTRLSTIGTYFLAETPVCRVLLPPTVRCFGPFAFCKVTSQELVLSVPSLEVLEQTFLEFSFVEVLIFTLQNGQEANDEDIALQFTHEHHSSAGLGLVAGGATARGHYLDLTWTNIQSTYLEFLKNFRALDVLILPKAVTAVGHGFLSGLRCRTLDLSRTKLQIIGWNFLKNSMVEELLLPASLHSIGHCFLAGCEKLQRIDLQSCSIETLGDNFAANCDCLLEVQFPATLKVIGTGFLPGFRGHKIDLSHTQLERIGPNFLQLSNSIEELLLPATLKVIEGNFLTGCGAITRLHLRGCSVETVGGNFARRCDGLVEVVLPATVKTIAHDFLPKFRGRKLDLSHTHLESIGSNFLEDSSIEELLLPATLKSIGHSFMAECRMIQRLDLGKTGLTTVGNCFLPGCEKLQRIDLESCSIETLGDNFAANCDCLLEVQFPATLKVIGTGFLPGFRGRQIDLSHTQLERIGSNFLESSSVEEVLLPATLMVIEGGFLPRFCGRRLDLSCTKLESIAPSFLKASTIQELLLPPTLKEIGGDLLPEFRGRKLDLSRTQLKRIGLNFLQLSNSIEELWLPATLKVIGDNFLTGCGAITRLYLQGCSVETVGGNFARRCGSLVGVVLPATLKSIAHDFLPKFRGRKLDLSHTQLESIGSDFLDYSSIEELLLPATLKSIGHSFMAECRMIQRLDLGRTGLTTVGNCFAPNCDSLVEVIFPRTIRTIGNDFLVGFKGELEYFGDRFHMGSPAPCVTLPEVGVC